MIFLCHWVCDVWDHCLILIAIVTNSIDPHRACCSLPTFSLFLSTWRWCLRVNPWQHSKRNLFCFDRISCGQSSSTCLGVWVLPWFLKGWSMCWRSVSCALDPPLVVTHFYPLPRQPGGLHPPLRKVLKGCETADPQVLMTHVVVVPNLLRVFCTSFRVIWMILI